jgi:hypothetical protein
VLLVSDRIHPLSGFHINRKRRIMRTVFLFILTLSLSIPGLSQNVLTGDVHGLDDKDVESPVPGAMVFWMGTTKGTSTDSTGSFRLPFPPLHGDATTVVVWHAAFIADTIRIVKRRILHVVLRPAIRELAGVSVVGERGETVIDFMRTQPLQIITEKELFKAACCNLSESFETNASVDVSFTDAITGARQIELFFKWIKQHLRIKGFYGTTPNAVKTQIWIAVAIYVLVAILKKELKLDQSLYTILQILSVTLFQ